MISIQPKWCELICSGKKTVEVRKTKPKLETPFKCYIYCTKDNTDTVPSRIWWKADKTGFQHIMNGKVIGEFVCDGIIVAERGCYSRLPQTKTMINSYDLLDYADGEKLYGWNISNLVIYDKPKDLNKFYRTQKCDSCETGYESSACIFDEECNVPVNMTRPPQSWCYVEE